MADQELLMTVMELERAVQGSLLANYSSLGGCSSVATDSRKVKAGSLFIPLMGEVQDGHSYIPQALESGASVVFVDEAHARGSSALFAELAKRHEASFIAVANTLAALQDAAKAYVERFPRLVKVGITGSSGKTTTKEITARILGVSRSVVMNEGNLNSETGLPLSAFSIRDHHEVGIFELGMNRRGEIHEIARVLRPSIALITNVGTAHIGILGSKAAIAEEKKAIFSNFDEGCVALVPEDSEFLGFLSDIPRGSVRSFGLRSTEGVEGWDDNGLEGSVIRYRGRDIAFGLPGAFNLMNAVAAIAIANELGASADDIKSGLESVTALFGRTEVMKGPVTIIRDCYNANPESMASAIDFCDSVVWKGKKVYVIGSMLELGDDSASAHRDVCARLARSSADRIFLFGDEMTAAGGELLSGDGRVTLAASIEELRSLVTGECVTGDLVFLKGSRGMALERVSAALTEKAEESRK